MYYLSPDDHFFPPAETATKSGILAVGGDLSVERLIVAYKNGIFPWFDNDEPILWWSPAQRMVLYPDEVEISKSMRRLIGKEIFQVTFNSRFREVILNCQQANRNGQQGTWITDGMLEAYCRLHEMGIAKSVEVWLDDELVGGLYGIDLGHIFCGESMFSQASNASKIAFITLAQKLRAENYKLIDCQVHNDHLESLGAREIPRKEFLRVLRNGV